jgi:hypothetical protein
MDHGIDTTATYRDGEPAVLITTESGRVWITNTLIWMEPTYDGHGPQGVGIDIDNGQIQAVTATADREAFQVLLPAEQQARAALRADGLVLTSPDGSRWLLSPDNDGDPHFTRLSDATPAT